MPILTVIFVIVIVGVLLWACNSYIPLDPKIRTILNVVVPVLLVIWLVNVFGLLEPFKSARVGRGTATGCSLSHVGIR